MPAGCGAAAGAALLPVAVLPPGPSPGRASERVRVAGIRRERGVPLQVRRDGGAGAARCGAIRPLEPETGLEIADVLGRGNARFPILIHESPPAWLQHARYVCFESGVCGRKVKARTVTNEARTILMPSKPVKRTPPNHSVFMARGGLRTCGRAAATSSRGLTKYQLKLRNDSMAQAASGGRFVKRTPTVRPLRVTATPAPVRISFRSGSWNCSPM